ncbi:restriction endonuclease fold toxin 5 domain-containing protein [Herbaspirillum sp. DW155]|uniref:restriction endonuclease fold toxin 5 domain-containing protein n=1 Tax=Herbaspirillum sp. DW155 TaxID=3095609 RepID=UPI003090ECE4|nr:restriction endonuclease fold toxin 5 domain-containing protein [Herbaspirillum sp. DW155]
MGFLAIPFVPAISAEVAAWLGLAGTAAVAGGAAAVYTNSKKAEEAQSKPLAQVDVTKQSEKCKECPPNGGAVVSRRWNMSDISREYQARVTGFAPYTEWAFSGVDFDGFRSPECLLQEAKARYAQFFDQEADKPKFFFSFTGYRKLLTQAAKQNAVTTASSPARLNWYFMEKFVANHMRRRFSARGLLITVVFMP